MIPMIHALRVPSAPTWSSDVSLDCYANSRRRPMTQTNGQLHTRHPPASPRLAARLTAVADNLAYRLRLAGPERSFRSDAYLRHNQRRQEHLATLGLSLNDRTVLEVGAGIGDHTGFFVDRDCQVTITEGREINLARVKGRFPDHEVRLLDLECPDPTLSGGYDIVYCYGLLYHLSDPAPAISYLAERCTGLMLIETCVSMGEGDHLNPTREPRWNPSQAIDRGCRPTRLWVWNRLALSFPHVYATTTQPWHDEFPLDWTVPADGSRLTRAVFVASRQPLALATLTPSLPRTQTRC